jgi:hypothetical protein
MKTTIIFLTLALAISTQTFAQTDGNGEIKRNGIYAEFYGIRHAFSSGLVSINYERNFFKDGKTALRIGVYPDFKTTFSFPITFTWIAWPLKKHHLEYGAGAVFRLEFYEGNIYKDMPAVMIPIMYRYQNNKGLFFRAGVNVWISWPSLVSPSLSLGYKF